MILFAAVGTQCWHAPGGTRRFLSTAQDHVVRETPVDEVAHVLAGCAQSEEGLVRALADDCFDDMREACGIDYRGLAGDGLLLALGVESEWLVGQDWALASRVTGRWHRGLLAVERGERGRVALEARKGGDGPGELTLAVLGRVCRPSMDSGACLGTGTGNEKESCAERGSTAEERGRGFASDGIVSAVRERVTAE